MLIDTAGLFDKLDNKVFGGECLLGIEISQCLASVAAKIEILVSLILPAD